MFDHPSNIQKTELICLDADTIEAFAESLVEKIKKLNNLKDPPFLNTKEACQLLRCNDETLRKYWKEGLIIRSEFSDKHIVYDRASILEFVKNHKKKYGGNG